MKENDTLKNLTLLIKPASGQCNLRCKYCFYFDVSKNREKDNYGMMSEDTLEALIMKAYRYANGVVNIGFQGGEPMLRGLDFYKRLIALVETYNVNHIQTNYSIQTNGVLIDEKWATFFCEHNFLVGVSIDGYKEIHDAYRVDKAGEGTLQRISQSVVLLKKYEVDFNVLCVVTKRIAQHGLKVYRFFKKQGFEYIQFIPCLEKFGEESGAQAYSITPKLYGQFLITLFNEWFADLMRGEYISIRMFDNILNILTGAAPESCDMVGKCARGTIVEADGSVYPCDFYVVDKWNVGNIFSDEFEEMMQCKTMDNFVLQSMNIDPKCRSCAYFSVCRGGCRRHKEPIIEGEPLKNYFCESYKMFYSECLPRFKQIVSLTRMQK